MKYDDGVPAGWLAPSPYSEVHPRTKARDRAVANLKHSPHLMLWCLSALYLTTGRYIPQEAKVAREIRLGFCDQAGNPVSQSDATHIGWSLS